MLPSNDYAMVVKKTPIVAVDFVIENGFGEVLLGKRKNNPAKGFFFTFGGAILKDEKIKEAIERVSLNEIGYKLQITSLSMINVFEFFYPNNFLNNFDFTTHYIAISYHYKDMENKIVPYSKKREDSYYQQHSEFLWMNPKAILESPRVHDHCKSIVKYFF